MAKKTDKTEERIVAVEEAFSKTERFIEDNQKIILIVLGVIIVLVLGYFGFKRYYIAPRETRAQAQMFMAEKYFEQDSLNKALNGDGPNPGFLTIIDDYGMTKSANLAHYYAGIIYLKKGEYQNAITQLKKFDSDGSVVGQMAMGATADAYMELKDAAKAADLYTKAAEEMKNELISPMLYMKAGWAYESAGDYQKAVDVYKKLKENYLRSTEGRDIDKYIANASALAGKK
ncbi:MAG: tetratricopeptide repeat protein [Syntrophothermus sp.]